MHWHTPAMRTSRLYSQLQWLTSSVPTDCSLYGECTHTAIHWCTGTGDVSVSGHSGAAATVQRCEGVMEGGTVTVSAERTPTEGQTGLITNSHPVDFSVLWFSGSKAYPYEVLSC